MAEHVLTPTATTGRTIETEMDEAGDLLGLIVDTFGPDHTVTVQTTQTYRQIISGEDGANPYVYAVGTGFLKHVRSDPGILTQRKATKGCNCRARFLVDEDGRWRPCANCLPGAYSQWTEAAGEFDDGF